MTCCWHGRANCTAGGTPATWQLVSVQPASLVSPGQCLTQSLAAVAELKRVEGQGSFLQGEWRLLKDIRTAQEGLFSFLSILPKCYTVAPKREAGLPPLLPAAAPSSLELPPSTPKAAGRRAESSSGGPRRKELLRSGAVWCSNPRGVPWGG